MKRISNKKLYKAFIQKSFADKIIPKGKALLTFCDVSTPEAKEMEKKVMYASKNSSWEEYTKIKDEFHRLFTKRTVLVDNIVTRDGREIFARLLKGDTTYSGEINYCALGTGDTASTTSDTTLETENYRKQISSGAYSTYHTYISTFFSATETYGTYKEIGHVIDGEAGADTGKLFSRIADPETAELPITKSDTESLTIDYSCDF